MFTTPTLLGIRAINIALRLISNLPRAWKLMENIHDIFFENLPTSLKEGAKALSSLKAFTISKTLFSSKALSIHTTSSSSIESKDHLI
jgi:hypothetical protein